MEWWALSCALVGASYYVFMQAASLLNAFSFPLIAIVAGLIGGSMASQEDAEVEMP